ncbi:methyltransferase domain-containing protein [Citrifermentans bemidjiense]|uniref:methyltransferase domain-containing protein n=1 Tax=Citrifermentans bemidjiense TaxID=225194 RepID=UPI00030E7C7D|nr:methyltransferase domain-containing protein [Citrifermentans bemidjiense]
MLDAYQETQERHWVPLVVDRPTVLGFVEHLPFKDKAFDFVIASHVLEHSTDPARFLSELQRVAKAGYIEVPDAFMERINPYRDHRLEITVRSGKLIIRKKPDWRSDPELVELYEHRVKAVVTRQTMPHSPFDFHVRFYWKDTIDFEVLNEEVSLDWEPPQGGQRAPQRLGVRHHAGQLALKFARNFLSQKKRNGSIELMRLLACPTCGGTIKKEGGKELICASCSARYQVKQEIPHMYQSAQTAI